MKISILIFTLMYLLTGCASVPPERQLLNYFNQQNSNPELLSNPESARWVAYGNLKGVVFQDYNNGLRYFTDVPINHKRAIEIYEKLSLLDDKVGIALLGIIYRQGIIVEEDLDKSLQYLARVKNDYSDAAGEYGIAMHQKLRKNSDKILEKDIIDDMVKSLELSASSKYIPALNALSQLYKEGKFVAYDNNKSIEYKEKSKLLIDKKLALNKNINESRMLANKYAYEASIEANKFNNMTFLIGLGLLGAMSYNPTYQNCTIGCSPPSTVDLLNWGVL